MPIISFADLFTQAANSVQRAADQARYLKNTTGDMPMTHLLSLWQYMAQANVATTDALAKAATNVTAANAALPQFTGAPQTVAALQTGLSDIQTAAASFKSAVTGWVASSLTPADLLAFQSITNGAVTSDVLQFAPFIPAAKFDAFRALPELAALITAFEAIGATA